MEGYRPNVLAVNMSGNLNYDMFDAYWSLVESKLKSANEEGLNLLIRIDNLSFDMPKMTQMLSEATTNLLKRISDTELSNLRRVAVIGNSEVQKKVVEIDSILAKFLNKEIEEKYYDIEDLAEAKEFVNKEMILKGV